MNAKVTRAYEETRVWVPTPDHPEMDLDEIDRELATVRHRTVSSRSISGYTYQALLARRKAITFGAT